jgi:PAS domain S-box-containing protein
MRCTRDDGSAIWTNVAAVPTLDARGQVNGFVCAISDITERKRADAVLRERGERERSELKNQVRDGVARNQASRDLLQAAIDASTDMIQVFEAVRDERGEIVDFVWVLNNHTSERRYGEVRGESLLQRNPGVVREGIFDTFKRVVETGVPTQSERYYAHEQFDGWFYQSVVRLGDGVATTTKDIDAWKAAQAELLRLQHEVSQGRLRESEERFRLLVESVRDYAIFTTDTDGFITAWPAGAANVYGWSEQDILGRSVDLTFVPEDIVARQPQRERALAVREGVAPNIRWHLRSDGSRIFIDGSTQPLTGSDGTIREFIKIGQDVTEARRVQQALSDSERWQRALIEGIPQLVWRAVDRGHWTWASPQWSAFTGQAEPASHDLGWLEPVHPDDRDRVMTIWDGATRRGEFHADYRIWHVEEARHRWFQTRASPVRNEASEVVEWLGTSTDIEDMRALQTRQATLLAELQHRVRNILAVTRSIISRSDDGHRSTEEYVQHLQGRIGALARTQVLLTRTAGQPVDLTDIILDELQSQAASEDQYTLEGADVRLSPKTAEVVTLAIHELTTNATKYGAFSRRDARLTVRWQVQRRDERDWLVLHWQEFGVPIVEAVPRHRGFGAELVSRRIPYELKGHGSLELRPGGVESCIEFPLVDAESVLQTDAGGR